MGNRISTSPFQGALACQQFPQCPYVVGNASFDGGRNPNRLVNTAETVVRKVQGASELEVVEFLGAGVRQAREAAKRHADREVASLAVKRESIRGQLETMFFGNPTAERIQELIRCFGGALTHGMTHQRTQWL